MPLERVECNNGHSFPLTQSWFLALNWYPEWPCDSCGEPMRWFGSWSAPKAQAGEPATRYEVRFVARFERGDPFERWTEEGYLPFILVCEYVDHPGQYDVWPRYFVKPGESIQFGQDGPRLSLEEWDCLLSKVRQFLDMQRVGA